MKYSTLHILCRNGWTWEINNDDDYFRYAITVLGVYHTKVCAAVASCSQHLCINGHYGVLWLEVDSYECEPPYGECDLEDMLYALVLAEENLLRIGMPFAPDYKFHGNVANKKRRNEKLRRMYDLDRMEQEDRENERRNS